MQNMKLRMRIFLFASIANLVKLIIDIIKVKTNSNYQTPPAGMLLFFIVGVICFLVFLDARKKFKLENQSKV